MKEKKVGIGAINAIAKPNHHPLISGTKQPKNKVVQEKPKGHSLRKLPEGSTNLTELVTK